MKQNDQNPQCSDIDLSVIIVSYENLEIIRDCLYSIMIFNDIGDRLETIVVEQSRTPEVYQELSREFPAVTVIRNENNGFGAGNNRGAATARGRYLLFLNSDTVLIEPVFGFAVARFENNPELSLFGMRLVSVDGGKSISFFPKDGTHLLSGLLWRVCDRFELFLPSVMLVSGADMFVRKDAFFKVGCFDESMFMYYEERDLCGRVVLAGGHIGYFPEKRIVHLEGASSGKNYAIVVKREIDSIDIVLRKEGRSRVRYFKRWRRKVILKQLLRPREDYSEELIFLDVKIRELEACDNA